jgi:hypothetical protein
VDRLERMEEIADLDRGDRRDNGKH